MDSSIPDDKRRRSTRSARLPIRYREDDVPDLPPKPISALPNTKFNPRLKSCFPTIPLGEYPKEEEKPQKPIGPACVFRETRMSFPEQTPGSEGDLLVDWYNHAGLEGYGHLEVVTDEHGETFGGRVWIDSLMALQWEGFSTGAHFVLIRELLREMHFGKAAMFLDIEDHSLEQFIDILDRENENSVAIYEGNEKALAAGLAVLSRHGTEEEWEAATEEASKDIPDQLTHFTSEMDITYLKRFVSDFRVLDELEPYFDKDPKPTQEKINEIKASYPTQAAIDRVKNRLDDWVNKEFTFWDLDFEDGWADHLYEVYGEQNDQEELQEEHDQGGSQGDDIAVAMEGAGAPNIENADDHASEAAGISRPQERLQDYAASYEMDGYEEIVDPAGRVPVPFSETESGSAATKKTKNATTLAQPPKRSQNEGQQRGATVTSVSIMSAAYGSKTIIKLKRGTPIAGSSSNHSRDVHNQPAEEVVRNISRPDMPPPPIPYKKSDTTKKTPKDKSAPGMVHPASFYSNSPKISAKDKSAFDAKHVSAPAAPIVAQPQNFGRNTQKITASVATQYGNAASTSGGGSVNSGMRPAGGLQSRANTTGSRSHSVAGPNAHVAGNGARVNIAAGNQNGNKVAGVNAQRQQTCATAGPRSHASHNSGAGRGSSSTMVPSSNRSKNNNLARTVTRGTQTHPTGNSGKINCEHGAASRSVASVPSVLPSSSSQTLTDPNDTFNLGTMENTMTPYPSPRHSSDNLRGSHLQTPVSGWAHGPRYMQDHSDNIMNSYQAVPSAFTMTSAVNINGKNDPIMNSSIPGGNTSSLNTAVSTGSAGTISEEIHVSSSKNQEPQKDVKSNSGFHKQQSNQQAMPVGATQAYQSGHVNSTSRPTEVPRGFSGIATEPSVISAMKDATQPRLFTPQNPPTQRMGMSHGPGVANSSDMRTLDSPETTTMPVVQPDRLGEVRSSADDQHRRTPLETWQKNAANLEKAQAALNSVVSQSRNFSAQLAQSPVVMTQGPIPLTTPGSNPPNANHMPAVQRQMDPAALDLESGSTDSAMPIAHSPQSRARNALASLSSAHERIVQSSSTQAGKHAATESAIDPTATKKRRLSKSSPVPDPEVSTSMLSVYPLNSEATPERDHSANEPNAGVQGVNVLSSHATTISSPSVTKKTSIDHANTQGTKHVADEPAADPSLVKKQRVGREVPTNSTPPPFSVNKITFPDDDTAEDPLADSTPSKKKPARKPQVSAEKLSASMQSSHVPTKQLQNLKSNEQFQSKNDVAQELSGPNAKPGLDASIGGIAKKIGGLFNGSKEDQKQKSPPSKVSTAEKENPKAISKTVRVEIPVKSAEEIKKGSKDNV